MLKDKILVLDRQEAVRSLLAGSLASEDREVICTAPADDPMPEIVEQNPELLILDPVGLPRELPELLSDLKSALPTLSFIILSSINDVNYAVDAMRLGAFDFLPKPIPLPRLLASVELALQDKGLDRELSEKRRLFKISGDQDYYKSTSESMSKVYDDSLMVAMSKDTTTLITGESGTGKEIIGQLIHGLSPRHKHPFMELNCAAIPAELLESEIFGHEAGAFTDAKESKPGLFEMANKGSILLDEIGEMSMNLQVKLLRFLERKTFRRVGGTRDIEVDVRIISATNRDLKQMVKEKRFREDLFYRLNVVPIKIPALRDRREDILPLIGHFFKDFNPRFNKNFTRIGERARRQLMDYPWPGNIRELRNVVERVVLMEDGPELTFEQLQPLLSGSWEEVPETFARRLMRQLEEPIPDDGVDLVNVVQEVERSFIEKAFIQSGQNQSKAAEMLKLGRDKMRYRMKQLAIEKESQI
ncbi:MAG: sigma-54-dependent Fis family transcriptional regulator [bacterium]|nr:sigma-54-dependent Fis family transcriptional regulator [bacterium]